MPIKWMLFMVKPMPELTLLMLMPILLWLNLTDANFDSVDTHANADHVEAVADTDHVEADANTDHIDADGYADHVVGIRSNDWIFSGRPGHRSWH